YDEGMGWDLWNAVATVGALTIAVSILVFMLNVARTLRSGVRTPEDPWDARTLEWATTSPPPAHNFTRLPPIRSDRPVFDERMARAGAGDGHPPPPPGKETEVGAE
ncbi:MAG: cytochrome ubiquinol oxidase subunit I, partial [Acidimicrobiales bacterium]